MSATFYSYDNLIDFMNDIIKGKRIWTRYGLIHSFTISNVLTPIVEGYISIFIRNNNIIQNLSKFNFTLEQFKKIVFSNEVHGIEMYKKKFSYKSSSQILEDWAAMSNMAKIEYFDLGFQLTDQLDLYPSFLFPDAVTNPAPQKIMKDEILNLNENFKLITGLHKFVMNDEILFHIYANTGKQQYIITNLSDQISNIKDTLESINVYIENNNVFVQNKLNFDFIIKKYSNYD